MLHQDVMIVHAHKIPRLKTCSSLATMSDTTTGSPAAGPPLASTNEWVLKGVVPILVESVTWSESQVRLGVCQPAQVPSVLAVMPASSLLLAGPLSSVSCQVVK